MGPYTESAVDMLDFFERQRDWSFETFGPREVRGPIGPLKHLQREAEEAIEAEPEKLAEEIADCLFLVFDAAHRAGLSYSQLVEIAKKKLEKNKGRTWPDWRTADPNEATESLGKLPSRLFSIVAFKDGEPPRAGCISTEQKTAEDSLSSIEKRPEDKIQFAVYKMLRT